MAQRALLITLVILCQAVTSPGTLQAQVVPTLCACTDTRDVGSCATGFANYPGDFPGSTTVAHTRVGGQDVTYLYVVDLFDGFAYRYEGLTGGTLTSGSSFKVFVAPGGSSSTTGVVFNPIDESLYWAIEGILAQTNLDLTTLKVLGEVDLAGLRTALKLPLPGVLGGITFHETRGTFWGVDIANDVYFEFGPDGKLTGDPGQPIYFRNPLLNPYGGGAYGNSITYAGSGGANYFDIPVGTLLDGGVSKVVRVFAEEGGEGDLSFKIGDPTGVFYEVATAVGSYDFISGIQYWPSTCDPTNHTEILLDIAGSDSSHPPRIYQVSMDDPQAATVVNFQAAAAGNNVNLSWLARKPYSTLEILRRSLPAGNLLSLAKLQNPATDARELLDKNLGDGLYEYVARVAHFPDVKQRVAVGQGSIAAHVSYLRDERPADQDPYALTFIGSSSQLLVADRRTGDAHLYDTSLTFKGVLAGPFVKDALGGGLTTGVAWDPGSDTLLWVLQSSGGNFLQRTSTAGVLSGSRQAIDVPINIRHSPFIGGIAYDASRQEIWGVDLVNSLAYSFNALGDLTGKSSTVQLPVPRSPDGEFGGGVSVVQSDTTGLILDYVVGKAAGGGPGELARMSYGRTGAAGDQIGAGTELLTLDLRSTLLSPDIGGAIAVKEGDKDFEYAVGINTHTIYKLIMTSGLQGKEFRRGKVLNDGAPPSISDAITILNFLFKAGPTLPCEDAADLNDDEKIDITDAIALFSYLFKGGQPPPPPFLTCGRDFDPPLICREANCVN
jgi:hypothetical protein